MNVKCNQRTGIVLAVSLTLLCAALAHGEPTVLFTFDDADALGAWQGDGALVDQGWRQTRSLFVESADADRGAMLRAAVPADRIAGRLITLSAAVKAEGVSVPPNHWNGIKVMLVLEAGGGVEYPQIALTTGSFDWAVASRTLRVPKEVTKASLVLGLEKAGGKAWFDDVAITTGRSEARGRRQAVAFRGHDLPRLRGVMHGPRFEEGNLRDLARDWGANQVRWQLNWTPMKKAEEWARDLDAFDKWLAGALLEADKAVDACEKYGLHMLLDLHTPPGGRAEGGVCRMFSEKHYADKLVEAWRMMAMRYKGRKVIYAYDLINEPVEPGMGGTITWRELATRVARAIREVEPGKPVLLEPGPWGSADGFDTLTPLALENVIYSFHMYKPHRFTHQGVHSPSPPIRYPGVIEGVRWDKARLREAMLPAIDFQREYNVHMYVGEFSAIRWAPDNSAYRYLRDLVDLFEELGWDWSYHAFREWSGWSVEHGSDRHDHNRSAVPTDREKLLRSWFEKNTGRTKGGT